MLVHEGHAQTMRFFTRANSDSYDLILRLATFGQDIAWKHEIIRAVTNRSQILELACGTGILSSMLAERGKSVTGIDLTFEYLLTLKRKLKAPIAQGTAEVLPYRDESFDAMVSSYLAKYVDVQKVSGATSCGTSSTRCWVSARLSRSSPIPRSPTSW